MPATRKSGLKSKHIDDVALLLSQVVNADASPRQADELIDEISQLLWAVSSLDPDAENFLKHSDYVATLATRAQG
jgi:hypothetical protein